MSYVKSGVLLTALIVFTAILARDAAARQDVVLPELAPREVEITGDLTIVFPALRRQPLVGFNPPPPVPDIPSSRLPFAEVYKQPSADLPPSPVLPPEPPDVSTFAQRIPMNGKMEATLGRYIARSLSVTMAMGYSLHSSTLLNLDYRGSDGYEPFGASGGSSGYNKLVASLKHARRMGPIEVSVGASGFKHAYELFGLTPEAGTQALPHPNRDFSGAEGELGFTSLPGSRYSFSVVTKAGLSTVDSDIYEPSTRVDPATTRDETFISSRASLSLPITDGYIAFLAEGTSSGLDTGSFPGTLVQSGMTQVEASYLYSANLNIKGGLAVMGFRSGAQTVSDQKRSLAYLSPVLEASYSLSPALRAFAGNNPRLESGLQKNAYQQSPFIQDEALLLPRIVSVDAHTGVEFLSEYVTAKASLGYIDEPYRRYATAQTSQVNGYREGYATLAYEPATVMYGKIDLGVLLSPGMQLGIDAEYRKGELSTSKVDIPYFSPLSIGGFASASLLNGNALIQATVRHEGSRKTDLTGLNKTGGITLFGIEGSYFLNSTYGVSAGIRNLGASPEFWHLYPMESSTVFIGAKYRW